MGALQTPQQFHGRVLVEVQGANPLEAPENLHLTVPKSGSNIAQQCVDSYAFFHVHCSTNLGFWGLQDTLENIFWDLQGVQGHASWEILKVEPLRLVSWVKP